MKTGLLSLFFLISLLVISVQIADSKEMEYASDWYNHGLSLSNNGKYEEALQAFYTARSMDENFYNKRVGISYPIGWTLAKLGKYEEALKEFDNALNNCPTWEISPWAYYCKGWVLAKLGRYDEALEAINNGLVIAHNNRHLLYSKGYVLNKLGYYQEAVDAYDKSRWGWGEYMEMLGSYQESASNYDKAMVTLQGTPVLLNQETPNNLSYDCFDPTREQINEESILDWYKLGMNFMDQHNRWGDAMFALDNAFAKDPSNYHILTAKSICYWQSCRYDYALNTLNKSTEYIDYNRDSEGYQSAWYDKGTMLATLGSYEEALDCFNKVLAVNPDNYQAWYDKGYVLGRLGKYDEAVTAYDKSLAWDTPSLSDNAWSILPPLGTYHEATEPYSKVMSGTSQKNFKSNVSNKIIYQTSFSENPGWNTSFPKNYFWDRNNETYHFKSDENGGYAEYIIPFQRDSFTLNYDIAITHADSDSKVRFGLSEYNKTYAERNAIMAELTSFKPDYYWPKSGDKILALFIVNNKKGSFERYWIVNSEIKTEIPDFGEGKIYHVTLSFDDNTNRLIFQVTNNLLKSYIYDISWMTNDIGEFEGMNRILLTAEEGENAYIEGYIDNVILSTPTNKITTSALQNYTDVHNVNPNPMQSQMVTDTKIIPQKEIDSNGSQPTPLSIILPLTGIFFIGLLIVVKRNK
jgi:tetratricopeptide (TPR) repeat protein